MEILVKTHFKTDWDETFDIYYALDIYYAPCHAIFKASTIAFLKHIHQKKRNKSSLEY